MRLRRRRHRQTRPLHTLALDGIYVAGPTDDAPPVFVPAPEPTPDQVRWLCEPVATRARRLVERRPWQEPPEERATPMFKVVGEPPKPAEGKRLHARVEGFDLYASIAFAADQRGAVERFSRYALWGPVANGRLSSGPPSLLGCGARGTDDLQRAPDDSPA